MTKISLFTVRQEWKSLANHLTSDQTIVIHGNSCIILYMSLLGQWLGIEKYIYKQVTNACGRQLTRQGALPLSVLLYHTSKLWAVTEHDVRMQCIIPWAENLSCNPRRYMKNGLFIYWCWGILVGICLRSATMSTITTVVIVITGLAGMCIFFIPNSLIYARSLWLTILHWTGL